MRSRGSLSSSMASQPPGWKATPRALALAVCLALVPMSGSVGAAGLGRLTVQSALGQPLRAEVEVTSLSREDAASLAARLASPDAFRQAGLEYNPALAGLRFAVEPRGDRTFLKITTTQPINEPFVDMLVELNWATGKLLREYTFLLDPPDASGARATADAAQPLTPVIPSQTGAVGRPAARATAPAAAPVARPTARAAAQASTESPAPGGALTVRRGDTLSSVAAGVRPDGVSLEQTMVGLYRANPSAFIGNMNLLREGARMDVPDATRLSAIEAAEAGREVRMQSADFAAYRRRLAEAVPKLQTAQAGQSASGSVTGQVEDRAPAASGDKLTLSKPAAGATGGSAVGSQAAVEQSAAREVALKEANSRIAELEKNVQDLRKLLDLRNRSMADIQRQVDDARTAKQAVTGQVGPVAEAAKVDAPPAPSAAPAMPASPATASSEPVVAQTPAPTAQNTPAPVSPAPEAAATQANAPVAPPVPAAAQGTTAEKPPSQAAADPGLLDDLLDNPLLLPGLGGIAALGAGYALYAMRRRRKVESFEDSLVAADNFASNSLFGSTGGQSVDTSQGTFAASDGRADVPSTEVDPIAEADVYIAYGREAQAEDILREALARQPDRQPIRFKLLQIYAARNDLDAFETLARDMHGMTQGEGEDWDKAAALGASLDPLNPLYGATEDGFAHRASGASALASTQSLESTQEFDFPDLKLDLPSADAASAQAIAAVDEPLAAPPFAVAAPEVDDFEAPQPLETLSVPAAAPSASLTASSTDLAPVAQAGVDDGLPGLPNLDFNLDLDLPAKSASLNEPTRSAPVASSADTAAPMDFDLDLAALDNITRMRPPAAEHTAGDALPEFDLDLEPVAVEAEYGGETVSVAAGGSARWQEMSTKLDLASAYEEIGDKEGARELLREVLSGGDVSQQQAARTMLSKIG